MKNDLTVKLVMLLTVITITVMAVFIGLRLWMNWYEYNKEIDAKFLTVSSRIANTVNPTIWEIYQKSHDRKYSREVAHAILDAELKDPHLVGIKVYGNFGHLFMGKIKKPDGSTVDFSDELYREISPSIDRHQLYPIKLDQMTIGNVELFFTEAPLRGKLLESFLIDLAQTFTIGLATVLFLFYALRKSLVKPLVDLQTAKQAVDSMSDGVAILSPDGQILEVNNSFIKQTGYGIEDVLHEKLFMFERNSEETPELSEIWEIVELKGVWTGEVETTRKDGSHYPAKLSFTSVRKESGEVANRVVVIHDNTNEHRLQHSQRMETVGALAGGIAHDINNVLTPIMGWAELLSEDLSDKETTHRGLTHILKGTERAKSMIDQIMNFSRMNTSSEPYQVDLKQLILDSIGFIRATFPSSIQIETELSDQDLFVYGDPGKIEQVLINLYTNAMHAMEERGVLTIKAELLDSKRPGSSAAKMVHISVSDTGHGIPADVLDKIFEPYFTTKGSGKGNGFGLSTSIGIINKLEGELKVDTQVGVGSTFHIWLPSITANPTTAEDIRLDKTSAAARLPVANDAGLFQGLRVLLVDDEIENLKLGENMLGRLGCHTDMFSDSQQALTTFKSNPENYDLLITDQSMPQLQGHELCLAVREITPELPIIVITGQDLSTIHDKYGTLDQITSLRKPFRAQQLKAAITKLLGTYEREKVTANR
ncbi:hybrid sensor histidine kinase/response regulator [Sneathiella limimaris]|uniref:hybrid sensor histidine kinase/response regulator n=1 Tax=Sneathiella limimaris TaxID=1964213 RepID=UPI00146C465B|nr:ATP-binding protein [Sneathiella limimaris]